MVNCAMKKAIFAVGIGFLAMAFAGTANAAVGGISAAGAGSVGAADATVDQAPLPARNVGGDVAVNQLPAPVQSAIRSQGGGDPIYKIIIQNNDGQLIYRVQFQHRDATHLHPELVIAADGTLLKQKHMANMINSPAGGGIPER